MKSHKASICDYDDRNFTSQISKSRHFYLDFCELRTSTFNHDAFQTIQISNVFSSTFRTEFQALFEQISLSRKFNSSYSKHEQIRTRNCDSHIDLRSHTSVSLYFDIFASSQIQNAWFYISSFNDIRILEYFFLFSIIRANHHALHIALIDSRYYLSFIALRIYDIICILVILHA